MHTPSDDPALTLETTSPDETRRLAASIAQLLRPGDVVALSGELGAGKTCFVQGAAEGLGITDRVTSPTFVLVRSYLGGRLPLIHCDVYRLERLRDVDDLGDEVLAPDVVTFVEWADAVTALLPEERLDVDLTLAGVEDPDPARILRLRGRGEGWRDRAAELLRACGCGDDPSC